MNVMSMIMGMGMILVMCMGMGMIMIMIHQEVTMFMTFPGRVQDRISCAFICTSAVITHILQYLR